MAALKYPARLESNNPAAYGIVKAAEISGFKCVNTRDDLYTIPDSILSVSGNNTNNDALGQIWYVTSDDDYYKLVNFKDRNNANGWEHMIPLSVNNNVSIESYPSDNNVIIRLYNFDGTIDADTVIPLATALQAGVMSKEDKAKLDSIQGTGGEDNIIESIKVNGTALPITDKSVDIPIETVDLSNCVMDKDINIKKNNFVIKTGENEDADRIFQLGSCNLSLLEVGFEDQRIYTSGDLYITNKYFTQNPRESYCLHYSPYYVMEIGLGGLNEKNTIYFDDHLNIKFICNKLDFTNVKAFTGIKTINGQSLLGNGNIAIDFSFVEIVSSLEDIESPQLNKIYLVTNSGAGVGGSGERSSSPSLERNIYIEYIYDGNKFEKIGDLSSEINLTPYIKYTDLATSTKSGAMSSEDYTLLHNTSNSLSELSTKVDGIITTGGEPNVIEKVKVDGTELSVTTDKSVNITLPNYITTIEQAPVNISIPNNNGLKITKKDGSIDFIQYPDATLNVAGLMTPDNLNDLNNHTTAINSLSSDVTTLNSNKLDKTVFELNLTSINQLIEQLNTSKANKTELDSKADKSTTYTKTEVDAAISNIDFSFIEIATSLENITNPQENKIYLVPADTQVKGNRYAEYIYVSNNFEKFGEVTLTADLENYLTKTEAEDTYVKYGDSLDQALYDMASNDTTSFGSVVADVNDNKEAITLKADKSTTYTKTEIDNKFSNNNTQLIDTIKNSTKTINGNSIYGSGNIVIPSLTSYEGTVDLRNSDRSSYGAIQLSNNTPKLFNNYGNTYQSIEVTNEGPAIYNMNADKTSGVIAKYNADSINQKVTSADNTLSSELYIEEGYGKITGDINGVTTGCYIFTDEARTEIDSTDNTNKNQSYISVSNEDIHIKSRNIVDNENTTSGIGIQQTKISLDTPNLDFTEVQSVTGLKTVNGQSILGNGNISTSYTLPTASSTVLGGVKVGAGLSINNGVLSANGGGTADSVDWSNVQNKPTFSAVATSGSYNDLTDKPAAYTLPAATNESLGGVKIGAINDEAHGIYAITTDSENNAIVQINNATSLSAEHYLGLIKKSDYKSFLENYNWYKSITGDDTDTVINKYQEIVNFLDTYTEADTLANLLSNKADLTDVSDISQSMAQLEIENYDILNETKNQAILLAISDSVNSIFNITIGDRKNIVPIKVIQDYSTKAGYGIFKILFVAWISDQSGSCVYLKDISANNNIIYPTRYISYATPNMFIPTANENEESGVSLFELIVSANDTNIYNIVTTTE